jgi:hypothetical protein
VNEEHKRVVGAPPGKAAEPTDRQLSAREWREREERILKEVQRARGRTRKRKVCERKRQKEKRKEREKESKRRKREKEIGTSSLHISFRLRNAEKILNCTETDRGRRNSSIAQIRRRKQRLECLGGKV